MGKIVSVEAKRIRVQYLPVEFAVKEVVIDGKSIKVEEEQ